MGRHLQDTHTVKSDHTTGLLSRPLPAGIQWTLGRGGGYHACKLQTHLGVNKSCYNVKKKSTTTTATATDKKTTTTTPVRDIHLRDTTIVVAKKEVVVHV